MLRKRLTGFCALMMTVMLMISLLTGCGGAATMTYGDGGAEIGVPALENFSYGCQFHYDLNKNRKNDAIIISLFFGKSIFFIRR